MAIAAMVIIALFFMVPEARTLIEPLLNQTEQVLAANSGLFLIAFVLAVAATAVSWLISRLPRTEAPAPYRVIRRFRVG